MKKQYLTVYYGCIMPFFLYVLQLKKQDDGVDMEEPLIAEDKDETSQYMKM